MKKIITVVLLSIVALLPVYGQGHGSFEEYKARKNKEFNKYRDKKKKDFEEYRRKRNEEYANYLRKTWLGKQSKPKTPRPKDEPVPPVVFDDKKPAPVVPVPLPFDEVIPAPEPVPQPKPVEPIREVPAPKPSPVMPEVPVQQFTFYGTAGKVRFDKSKAIHLGALSENSIADAWIKLSGDDYTNMIVDCLALRDRHRLGDWAYLRMVKKMAESIFGKGTNEATLLTAFVYCQSGYKMRLGMAGDRLVLLYASRHHIYDNAYFVLDGENFYCLDDNSKTLRIANQKYPGEKPMSLLITQEPELAYKDSGSSRIVIDTSIGFEMSVSVNGNLLDFYSDYPSSHIGDNFVSRWAMYAEAPICKDVKKQVYPALKKLIGSCGQLEAVEKLLNFVQTGFEYEYDDKVWGHDRAFFAEESLHYPYCDCEDRSILFSHLVRELVGLDVILVFYPGHLATAVAFTDNVVGDYINLNGRKFTVCDPTYIGAPVGLTMPKMDNATAKVILLNK